jgi:rhodanese-related sulfurtransferase
MLQVTATELRNMLAAPESTRPLMIDVREPWEWQLARIDGAMHIPMQQVPSRIQEIDEVHPTVVICHHGVRSLQVVAYLERQGYTNLHNLLGGIDAWSRQVDSAVPLY